jgi:hypothetical protein
MCLSLKKLDTASEIVQLYGLHALCQTDERENPCDEAVKATSDLVALKQGTDLATNLDVFA